MNLEMPLDLQNRDFAILRALFESRIMTSRQMAVLHFSSKKEAAKKRLQKLKAVGLIAERKRHSTEPAVLFLTGKAFDLLKNHGALDGFPSISRSALERRAQVSDLTLRHELEIIDVKAAFHSAGRKIQNLAIAEFSTWPALHEFVVPRNGYGPEVLVKPDGFIRLHEKEADGGISEHTFFLEVDRSSETQETLVSRAHCYLQYYRTGGFAVRNGATSADFQKYPFRVLMVMKTAERRNNTAERLLCGNPPIYTQVCLSTLAEVTADPFGPIWTSPKSYGDAIQGTPFEATMRRDLSGYRRQSDRENHVERTARKFAMLAS